MITRTMFCPYCYQEDRPQSGQLYVVWGATRESFYILKSLRCGKRGFTPHICEFVGLDTNPNFVKVDVFCAMNGCGVSIWQKNQEFQFFIKDKERILLRNKDWNALQFLKHDPQFVI